MEVAENILVPGGVLLLAYAFVTGYLIGRVRGHQPEAPKYLVLSHTEPLMQGAMILGLFWVVRMSELDGAIEAVAAILVVTAAALQGLKELVSWLQGVQDEFAERPPIGYWTARVQSTMASIGLAIFVVGEFSGL